MQVSTPLVRQKASANWLIYIVEKHRTFEDHANFNLDGVVRNRLRVFVEKGL